LIEFRIIHSLTTPPVLVKGKLPDEYDIALCGSIFSLKDEPKGRDTETPF